MPPTEPNRTGVVVIRLWVERGIDDLRARVVEVRNLDHPDEVTRAAAGIDEICRIVRDFLVRFSRDGEVTDR